MPIADGADDDMASTTRRDSVLRAHDLHLLSAARAYDLSEKSERRRSARDLSQFYFQIVAAFQPDLFIEAGAKDADSSRRASGLLRQARIVAFEANPFTYREFQSRNQETSRVEYLHLALSDSPGEVSFNMNLGSDGTPQADGRGSLMERHDKGHGLEKITVSATTLDAFFSDFAFETCALWVDVEGASEAVLTGGPNTLLRASIVIIEVEDREYWENCWTTADVTAHLYEAGLVPIARDFEFGYQHNVVFVRESLLTHHLLRLRMTQHLSAAAHPKPTPTTTIPGPAHHPTITSARSAIRRGRSILFRVTRAAKRD